ncbi:MAG: TlpA disulfide reductase family protein [Phaeodactylibacter sp.]|uniref:TlpA family protein disulfide reductase n=1 Tax=Phaeodactylibacter sp. TaxID=1940289 RepID=UPI0032EBDD18
MYKLLIPLFVLWAAVSVTIAQEAVVEVNLTGCQEPLSLLQFDGSQFYPVQAITEVNDDRYQIGLPKQDAAFFYIGTSPSNMTPILLGEEDTVRLTGNCLKISAAKVSDSPLNANYRVLKTEMNALKQEGVGLIRRYQSKRDSASRATVVADMKALDEKKLDLLRKAEKQHPLFGPIVRLNTYLSYHNHGEGYGNEIEYFAKEYFGLADFSEPVYGKLPWVFEGFKEYANTLASIGISAERQQQFIEQAISGMEPGTPVHKLALSGVVSALKQKNGQSFTYFARAFIEAYKEKDPDAAASMYAQIEQMKALLEGGTAPSFSQAKPDGAELSLADFRGKVVLLDFWASWCGPCRRENPNVVKVYEKYKDKGFEILGISLDSNRDKWLKAIEADSLTWPHVSDLKGWQNEVAQLYGVRSIPHTVLIDAEGQVIANKLRGPALEAKLAEIFGE